MPTRMRIITFPFLLSSLFLLAKTSSLPAQFLPQVPRVQRAYVPPPLWVKVPGPKGMKITFYPGTAKPRTLTAPFTVALRPGYVYRVKVSNIPGRPLMEFFPTLEIRGSLISEQKFRAKDYPAALVFSEEDFNAIARDTLITKVVALERREQMLAVTSTADNPPQIDIPSENDPVKAATQAAIPFLILRMGEHEINEEELKKHGIPGTIWLPGDKSLPIPAAAPFLPWACMSLYDPLLGPASLRPEICLPDGGDSGMRVGRDFMGRLQGLDPSDTVAEYTDSAGRRKIAVSNRVCLCVPRFIIFRGEVNIANRFVYQGASNLQLAQGFGITAQKVPVLMKHQNVNLVMVGGKQALSAAEVVKGTMIFGQYEGVALKVGLSGTHGVSSTCQTLTGELPEKPLKLIKWPDKNGAQIGDVITFTLKYVNEGSRPIRNVVISDNLITRFEYIAGSTKSDRPANFTAQPNDHGSFILRWQITTDLPPGQSGMVTFQVRVR